MSDNVVRARYMGGVEMSMRVGEEEVLLQPRHIYELPKSVVVGRDDFKIQEDEPEKAVDKSHEER